MSFNLFNPNTNLSYVSLVTKFVFPSAYDVAVLFISISLNLFCVSCAFSPLSSIYIGV